MTTRQDNLIELVHYFVNETELTEEEAVCRLDRYTADLSDEVVAALMKAADLGVSVAEMIGYKEAA